MTCKPKHAPCSCGCGEMADECMAGGHPLAAFTVVKSMGSVCAELGHPGDTFNPWLRKTWCRCGEVVVEGHSVILPKWQQAGS